MKLGVVIAALLGLGLAVYLIARVGFDQVLSAAAGIGWGGFAVFLAYSVALYGLLGLAWLVLVPGAKADRWLDFVFGRMVRDSAAELLPFSQVGGFVIGARAVMLKGITSSQAFASTIVDVTTELLAQAIYIGIGIVLLLQVPQSTLVTSLVGAFFGGLILILLAAGGFVLAQRKGMARLEKLIAKFLPKALTQAAAMNQSMDDIYNVPWRFFASVLLHVIGWTGGALASYIALHLIDLPISFGAVFAIESLLCAVRSAAFFMPSAFGVQEAAYAMLGPLFGLPPSDALALSLLKRARDIAVGIPVLVLWQGMESKRWLAKKDAQNAKG